MIHGNNAPGCSISPAAWDTSVPEVLDLDLLEQLLQQVVEDRRRVEAARGGMTSPDRERLTRLIVAGNDLLFAAGRTGCYPPSDC